MKSKTIFYCKNCGNEFPRWQGQCPACGMWNTIEEHVQKPSAPGRSAAPVSGGRAAPKMLREVESSSEIRFSTGLGELDRVLGGGGVRGSLVLVGGAPGIGKSTLLLQICAYLGKTQRILYVSGEESEQQIKMRADRLGVEGEDLMVLAETDVTTIVETVRECTATARTRPSCARPASPRPMPLRA